jgi:dienelactone hydrolase
MRKFIYQLFFIAFCVTNSHAQDFSQMMEVSRKFDISESYRAAKIFIPSVSNASSVEKLEEIKPKNVVIYLHGCGGIGSDEQAWGKFLSEKNFAVVMPDSLAIKGRRRNCEVGSSTRNAHNVPVGPLRVLEARHALEQVSKIKSVEKIFLMGHSEGGATILMAPFGKFNGVISVGSFCSGQNVNINKSVPLLLINYESDPWFKDITNQCLQKTAHRSENTRELVLTGIGHEASGNSDARKAVLEFLNSNL